MAHNSCPQKNYVYVAIKNKDGFITQDTFKRLMKGELNDESLYVEYVGIANNVKRRSSEHGKTRIIHELVFDGNGTLTRDQARALEQLLINTYGKSQNIDDELLSNKINSVNVKKFETEDRWREAREQVAEMIKQFEPFLLSLKNSSKF
ncbi:MAG: hypothetical protein IKK39_01335 [Thermoguttaceae bacterium]|nr:hypothetical protein [Thermoguttaceae bacterium]